MADPAPTTAQPGSTAPTLSVEYTHRLADGRKLDIRFSSSDRVLALTGPSGIGKTTTLDVLHVAVRKSEVQPVGLSW